jgi:predicted SAM-dependent methyltransferase
MTDLMTLECNICGCTEFGDVRSRKNAMCKGCKSYERTRVAFLFLNKFVPLMPDSRVFHMAPEKGLYDYFRKKCGRNYRPVDLNPEIYPGMEVERFDLCSDIFDLEQGAYDLILHNHVMEHLPCNVSAVLLRLTMSLRDEGMHMFSVPILSGSYGEDFRVSHEEGTKRFGQFDHVRRFGVEDISRSIGMLFKIPSRYDLLETFAEEELTKASIPRRAWQEFSSDTIFRVTKADLRIRNDAK